MREQEILLSNTIGAEINWAKGIIGQRLESLNPQNEYNISEEFLLNNYPPDMIEGTTYSVLVEDLIRERDPDDPEWLHVAERLILILTLAPHVDPSLFEPFSILLSKGVGVDSLGGVKNNRFYGFIPTGETALFLLAGNNISLRRQIILKVFHCAHSFTKKGVFSLQETNPNLSRFCGILTLSDEYYSLLIEGKAFIPSLSPSFPAQHIDTEETWDDLVVGGQTRFALEEINIWLKENKQMIVDEQVSRKIKKGYRALFYGPSGTGKTMAASLIGKEANVPVFRIDLSVVVSKYIGETEKNLASIFDKAENRNWILFFDEADALFGKRTQTTTANDRYANQEVSYLLQRVENFNGLVILSSNLKSNMDSAFTRRFQTMIKFPVPNETLRKELFDRVFYGRYAVENKELLEKVVKKYELTGAEINNIFRYCAMMTLHHGNEKVTEQIFSEGVIKELRKKGKAL
ncbi:hypothetical protein GCM10009122_04990 [Fulvivirga kasyanovii]|uniref:ATP-binding protein n=1 Tax=Fulvivirga kasyanovii TaxID=396812 RepID=A0ABW9RRJ3_9BACT|nr:ATP-binding protein [Fulvivirga kasyanovii]MTI25590.1 ATP-binding protein [Fulvivirga kasyanovii]